MELDVAQIEKAVLLHASVYCLDFAALGFLWKISNNIMHLYWMVSSPCIEFNKAIKEEAIGEKIQ